jgi:hypothetical protein
MCPRYNILPEATVPHHPDFNELLRHAQRLTKPGSGALVPPADLLASEHSTNTLARSAATIIKIVDSGRAQQVTVHETVKFVPTSRDILHLQQTIAVLESLGCRIELPK